MVMECSFNAECQIIADEAIYDVRKRNSRSTRKETEKKNMEDRKWADK